MAQVLPNRGVDLGTVYNQVGTGIHTSYQYSDPIAAANLGYLRFTALSTTIVATSITSVQAKAQVSKNGLVWQDVVASDDGGATPFTVEQSFAIGAAGTAQENSFFIPPGYKLVRVGVKATGGAGQALESIAVSAQSYVA